MTGDPRVGLHGIDDLLGRWTFTRWIDDRRAGQGIDVRGSAVIRPEADGFVYEEDAQMTLPGHAPMTATRRYLIEAAEDHLAYFFEDGRYFHRVDLVEATPRCHHDCPPDSYDVTYDFTDWPFWSATWRVTGPRKDYTMRSTYRRG